MDTPNKQFSMSNAEFKRMQDDIKSFPNNEQGEYRGFSYEIKRPYNTYWCGYVRPTDAQKDQITDKQYDHIDRTVHGGITSGPIGFDCAHYTDYWSGVYANPGTYKDRAFVLNEIYNIIDYLNDGCDSDNDDKSDDNNN